MKRQAERFPASYDYRKKLDFTSFFNFRDRRIKFIKKWYELRFNPSHHSINYFVCLNCMIERYCVCVETNWFIMANSIPKISNLGEIIVNIHSSFRWWIVV